MARIVSSSLQDSMRSGLACQPPHSLGQEVADLIKRMYPPVDQDRRAATRTPIPFLFELAPLSTEVPELLTRKVVVVGKEISERGIGFYHQQPIPYRRGNLSIELPGQETVDLEVDLLWCRFTSLGWYESGGRLVGVSSYETPTARAG